MAGAGVVVSSITLTEVLRGGPRDAAVHRVLARIRVLPVTPDLARSADELLGATGPSGHRCAIDAVVAATALRADRPAILLTSDVDDLHRLVDEPDRPQDSRVVVVHVRPVRPVRPSAGSGRAADVSARWRAGR
ncbi:type II toxin-antitoxin system VapC family toxin [Frankia sp. QA3]|uniref:type II toxin-antitoxin system VapC family toxin n=1 Tax=Frankia sp. QA3 TaxID=710111 RepID=UPI0002EF7971|nr:PIN domain-containing protein [Frankia sp. QA3]